VMYILSNTDYQVMNQKEMLEPQSTPTLGVDWDYVQRTKEALCS